MRGRRAEINAAWAVADWALGVDFSFRPDILAFAQDISLDYILYSQHFHGPIFYFLLVINLPCIMSANAEVPNAWEDDWESQADVSSPQSPTC